MKSIPLEVKEEPKHFFRPFYSPLRRNGEYFSNPEFPTHVLIVGCGGGGGYLIPWIARFISQSRSEMIKSIKMVIMDGDKVEEKNLIRQNFTADEIGEYKAVAMADRCNRALGTDVTAIPKYYEGDSYPCGDTSHSYIMIGCVDRHEARMAMCEHFRNRVQPKIYIDVGNSLSTGQVFVNGVVKEDVTPRPDEEVEAEETDDDGETIIKLERDYSIITMDQIHENISRANPNEASPPCTIATSSGLQRMGVNIMTSILAFKVFEAVLTPDPLPYYEISFGENGFKTYMLDDLKWSGDSARSRKPVTKS